MGKTGKPGNGREDGAWIADEVLAAELLFAGEDVPNGTDLQAIDLDGITAHVAITRI